MAQMISGIVISFSSLALAVCSVQHFALNVLGFIAGACVFLNGRKKFLFQVLSEFFS